MYNDKSSYKIKIQYNSEIDKYQGSFLGVFRMINN